MAEVPPVKAVFDVFQANALRFATSQHAGLDIHRTYHAAMAPEYALFEVYFGKASKSTAPIHYDAALSSANMHSWIASRSRPRSGSLATLCSA